MISLTFHSWSSLRVRFNIPHARRITAELVLVIQLNVFSTVQISVWGMSVTLFFPTLQKSAQRNAGLNTSALESPKDCVICTRIFLLHDKGTGFCLTSKMC